MLAGGARRILTFGARYRGSQLLVRSRWEQIGLLTNCVMVSPPYVQASAPVIRLLSTRPRGRRISKRHDNESGESIKHERTETIINQDIGTMTLNQWEEAEKLLSYWAKQRRVNTVKSAWRLLDRMVEEKRHGAAAVDSPNWLNWVIGAWRATSFVERYRSRSMKPNEVLQKIDEYSPVLLPDKRTYHMVADAAVKFDPAGSPDFCFSILDRVKQEATTRPELAPDQHLAAVVIKAFSKSGRPDAAQRAENMLYEMKATGGDMEPSRYSYTSVIAAWANSGDPNAPRRAEELLQEMEDSSREEVYPDEFAFSAVIYAWAKSNEPGAMGRAEQILNHMWVIHEKGKEHVKPKKETYRTLIFEYAKKEQPQGAERLLRRLWHVYAATGDVNLRPDESLTDSVIFAYGKSDEPNSAVQAENLLRGAQAFAEAQGDYELSPSPRAFASVLHTLARSNEMSISNRTETVLDWMQDLSERGVQSAKPHTRLYNALLSSYSECASNDPEIPE